jgi:hypothetical protein
MNAHIADPVVAGLSSSRVWRCRSAHIAALYEEHVTDAHLEVAPGTLLEPLELQQRSFGSIAATHVLHRVPGTMADKGGILGRLFALLRPGGVLFGTTLLAGGVPQTLLSRAHLAGLNRAGLFANRGDHLEGLQDEFHDYRLTTRGSLALFEIRA